MVSFEQSFFTEDNQLIRPWGRCEICSSGIFRVFWFKNSPEFLDVALSITDSSMAAESDGLSVGRRVPEKGRDNPVSTVPGCNAWQMASGACLASSMEDVRMA